MKKTVKPAVDKLVREARTQVSPLAHTNIDQLVNHLAHLSQQTQAQLAQEAEQVNEYALPSHSQIQGWQLASGVELLSWKANLPKSMTFQRTAEPNEAVWSILITDSGNLVASSEQQNSTTPHGPQGMVYLYNHHLPLDVVLEGPGQMQLLLIRLKPNAWQHLLQNPPSHVNNFINDSQPRFHGFDLTGTCQEYFQKLLKDNFENQGPWLRLQLTLGICNEVFSQLAKRGSVVNGSSLRPRDSQRIHKVRQLLLSDFQTPLSLAEIGKQVGLGRDKLRQLFTQVYGTTPNKYYQQQRMLEARRLIIEENFSAMDAGFQVGYSHLGHFAQAFKKQFGCLPKDCKRQLS